MSLLHLFQRKKHLPSSSWERTSSPKPEVYLDEDGRRHRTDAPYLLPKDLQEVARLDYQHYLFRHVLSGIGPLFTFSAQKPAGEEQK